VHKKRHGKRWKELRMKNELRQQQWGRRRYQRGKEGRREWEAGKGEEGLPRKS
jgi:hypothetical protein